MPNINEFFDKVETIKTYQTEQGFAQTVKVEFIPKLNICDMLEEEQLVLIGMRVIDGYEFDHNTMTKWVEDVKHGLEIAQPENHPKNTPWENAANFKSPVITQSSYKFSDMIVGEVLGKKNLSQCSIVNQEDDNRDQAAENYGIYFNWQLNKQMKCWRDEQEALIYNLPFIGTVFKLVCWDGENRRPDSIMITYPNFCVNNDAKSMDRLQRFSYTVEFSQDEIEAKIRSGVWCEYRYMDNEDENEEEPEHNFDDEMQEFVVQQCRYDIDGDGYAEPYTVTVHKDSSRVCRITPNFEMSDVVREENGEIVRINKIDNIIKYGFLKDPAGGLLDVGYCWYLAGTTSAINTATNQVIDAGTLSNVPGGFLAKGFKARNGDVTLAPGQWIHTEVNAMDFPNSIIPNPTKEPSQTLYSLSQTLTDVVKEASSSINMANAIGANAPAATTLSLLMEQQQSATAIVFRLFRSMTKEFEALKQINKNYINDAEYRAVIGKDNANAEQDLSFDFILSPNSPNDISSKVMRVQQAFAAFNCVEPTILAGGNAKPLIKNFLETIQFADADQVIPEMTVQEELAVWAKNNPEMYQLLIGEKQRADAIASEQMAMMKRISTLDEAEKAAKIEDIQANAIKKIADAKYTGEKTKTEDIDNSIKKASAPAEIDKQFVENAKTMKEIGEGKMI